MNRVRKRLIPMSVVAVTAGLVAASAASASVSQGSPQPSTSASAGWKLYNLPVQKRSVLDSVATVDSRDAWAGGFLVNVGRASAARARVAPRDSACIGPGPFPSMMLRWSGRSWQQVTVPNLGRITSVSATSANAWAAADCGMMHWNGRRWTRVNDAPVPGMQNSAPSAIKAVSPTGAWLIGSAQDASTSSLRGFVERWDGRRWTLVSLPRLGDDYTLDSLDARGANDVWVAGTDYTGNDTHPEQLVLLHWDGHGWKRLPAPASGEWTKRVWAIRMLAHDDVWVAGWTTTVPKGNGATRRPMALHWNGHAWRTTPVPGDGELYDIASDRGRLRAIGDTYSADPSYTMLTVRLAGTSWKVDTVPVTGVGTLLAAATIPGGSTWTVGATEDASGWPHALIALRRR